MAQAVSQDPAPLDAHQTYVDGASSGDPQGDSAATIVDNNLLVSENTPNSPTTPGPGMMDFASAFPSVEPTTSTGTLAGRCKLPQAATVAKCLAGAISATAVSLSGAAQFGAIGGAVGAVLAGPVGWAVLGIAGLTVLGVAVWKSRLPQRIALRNRVNASMAMLTSHPGFSREGTQPFIHDHASLEGYLTNKLWRAVDRWRRITRQQGKDPLRELSQDRIDELAMTLWSNTEKCVLRARVKSSVAKILQESGPSPDGKKTSAVGGATALESDLADELREHVEALRTAALLQGTAPLDELSQERVDELARTVWHRMNLPVPKIGDSTYQQRCDKSEKAAREACHSAINLLLKKDPKPTSQEYLDAFAAAIFESYHHAIAKGGKRGTVAADDFTEDLDNFIVADCAKRTLGDEDRGHLDKLWREFPGFAALCLGLEGCSVARTDLSDQITKGEMGRWIADIYSFVFFAFKRMGAAEQWVTGQMELKENHPFANTSSRSRTAPTSPRPGLNANGPLKPIVSPEEMDRVVGKLAETVTMELVTRRVRTV